MPKEIEEIASADDGEIGSELLDWSGLSKIWEKEKLGEYYCFFSDVAEKCNCIDFTTKQWGGEAPGLSGVWFDVHTTNADKLRKEMEAIVKDLIVQKNSQEI